MSSPRWGRFIVMAQWVDAISLVLGVTAVVIHAGFAGASEARIRDLYSIVAMAMASLGLCRCVHCFLSRVRGRLFDSVRNSRLLVPLIWIAGLLLIRQTDFQTDKQLAYALWSHAAMSLTAILWVLSGCRRLAAQTHNYAVLLVGSFLIVIAVGTLALRLPVCRVIADDGTRQSADWNVALFTATSACCVTGLVVEPTGSYWSPVGHAVIFGLFQIGGLGILTFGAFVAVLSGRRSLQFREARTLREMLDADSVHSSRRLLVTILLFTILVEAAGTFAIMDLWNGMSTGDQIWQAAFHSVSAFCNAGFVLNDDGFLHMGTRWQVWGPLSALIILGGLGFPVIQDLWTAAWTRLRGQNSTPLFGTVGQRPRLTLHTTLVLWSTGALLGFGMLLWFILESLEAPADASVTARFADSWFQSVTFRTAGFHTADHSAMNPATKLLAIFLMFIGAAPGSTGGGIKTVVFAIVILNIRSVFRGRAHVEAFGRRIPATEVSRALSMIAIGIFIVLATTGLLVIFERQPDRFLDHLFEATSAFGTVGVSAGVTADLSIPSRLLICAVMFLGRVGPITLLLAMAAPHEPLRYDYPEERVSLG